MNKMPTFYRAALLIAFTVLFVVSAAPYCEGEDEGDRCDGFCEKMEFCFPDTFDEVYSTPEGCADSCDEMEANGQIRCLIDCDDAEDCTNLQVCIEACRDY